MFNLCEEKDLYDCCGCGACVNVCPTEALSYAKDKYGFIVPKVNLEVCVNCGKCTSVCPMHNILETNNPHRTYAAINKSAQQVKDSSSGGIFVELANLFITNNGVVYGASMCDNFQVHHIRVDTIEDVPKLQKSKYVQSSIGFVFSQVKSDLKDNKNVLFSGTPCQIAGLKNYLGKTYDRLLTVDVVCHGVPSQDLFDAYIQEKFSCKKLEEYVFRAKPFIKNGMNCFFSYKKKTKKKVFCNWPQDSYNYFYMKGITYRDSCYTCRFANLQRVSDISLCDFWGWEHYHRSDFPKESSVSAILINTPSGLNAFTQIKGRLDHVESSIENVTANNGCLIGPTKLNDDRNRILNMWKNTGYRSVERDFKRRHLIAILKYSILMKYRLLKKETYRRAR